MMMMMMMMMMMIIIMLMYILTSRSFFTVSQQINKFCFHKGTFSHRKAEIWCPF